MGETPYGNLKSFLLTSCIMSKKAHIGLERRPTERILVVDDDCDARQLTVDLLTISGYDVEAVKDGAAGFEAVQAKRFDLIVTDNSMPKMSGVEMIEKVRSTFFAFPVIMATSYLPVAQFARRPWLTPDVMLEKPFSNDDLLAAVKKILHRGNGGGEPNIPPTNYEGQPLPNGLGL